MDDYPQASSAGNQQAAAGGHPTAAAGEDGEEKDAFALGGPLVGGTILVHVQVVMVLLVGFLKGVCRLRWEKVFVYVPLTK